MDKAHIEQPIRLLIADDHPILRAGLRKLLEAEQDFIVVGEAASGHEAVELTRELLPDVLLLDFVMPGVPCMDVVRTVKETAPATRTLLLTANIESGEVVKALQLGARGVVMKESATEMLMKAIRLVMSGQYWIGREGIGGLVDTLRAQDRDPGERPFRLTVRELDIIRSVAAGLTNREIARRATISEETVKHHLTKIFAKVGVTNRLELALFALTQALIDAVPKS
jgi:two-component system, NarL family, nitrate/nitrite response regulator NarL